MLFCVHYRGMSQYAYIIETNISIWSIDAFGKFIGVKLHGVHLPTTRHTSKWDFCEKFGGFFHSQQGIYFIWRDIRIFMEFNLSRDDYVMLVPVCYHKYSNYSKYKRDVCAASPLLSVLMALSPAPLLRSYCTHFAKHKITIKFNANKNSIHLYIKCRVSLISDDEFKRARNRVFSVSFVVKSVVACKALVTYTQMRCIGFPTHLTLSLKDFTSGRCMYLYIRTRTTYIYYIDIIYIYIYIIRKPWNA